MLFGSGKEAELNDKEVEIDVGDILDALTGIFTYNPEDEDPQGDPPGPWDGYSLFTIDLTAVKQSLEDIIAALQQHDPDYDPDENPPEDAVEDLIEENEQQEQTIEDLTEQVEECDQCKDDVIAKLQEYDPDFDPHTCSDIPPEIDKVIEEAPDKYTFDPEVTIPDLSKIVAGDVSVSAPNSEWEVKVFLYAESYDGSVTQRVRTLHTGGESWFFRPAIAFIYDGEEQAVVMPTNYRYQIGPSDREWVSITEWSITNTTTVELSWVNQDGTVRTWSGYYAGADLTQLMTGPYTVTKSS